MNITPKNKRLDLCILQHLEQLLGLGWVRIFKSELLAQS